MRHVNVTLCDVVVVGAGIAGVSIAERIAREAARQGRLIRVLVVEAGNELGGGASSKLEGWFHSGALYSMLDSTSTLFALAHSFEDLYNWYFFDPLFNASSRGCNLRPLGTAGAPRFNFDSTAPHRWFTAPMPYLVPDAAAGIATANGSAGAGAGDSRINRSLDRINRIFTTPSWRDEQLGCCYAPHSVGTATAAGPRLIRDSTLDGLNLKYSSADDRRLAAIDSPDATMNPTSILTALSSSAADFGVTFCCGYALDHGSIRIDAHGTADSIKGLVLDGGDSKPALHVIASEYIFAVGAGFADVDFLRDRLDLRIQVHRRSSVMLVAEPALCSASFVRLDATPDLVFNHICRSRPAGDRMVDYSLIADDNSLPGASDHRGAADVAQTLIAKSRHYFGDALDRSRLGWYQCMKTEFSQHGDDTRQYSYWWAPQFRYWSTPRWDAAREGVAQTEAENVIKELVRAGDTERGHPALGHFSGSSWAVKKALHFALLALVSAEREGHDADAPRRSAFDSYQRETIRAFSETQLNDRLSFEDAHSTRTRTPLRGPNFLVVVPGKFSLFPTVAHGVYLELESRGLFAALPLGAASHSSQPHVAVSHSEAILSTPSGPSKPKSLRVDLRKGRKDGVA